MIQVKFFYFKINDCDPGRLSLLYDLLGKHFLKKELFENSHKS